MSVCLELIHIYLNKLVTMMRYSTRENQGIIKDCSTGEHERLNNIISIRYVNVDIFHLIGENFDLLMVFKEKL